MIHKAKVSRIQDGREIPGTSLPAFIHNGGTYYLTDIGIYQDGIIDCWGLVDFEEFERKVARGWVATSLPEGATISIHLLANFRVQNVSAGVYENEFIKEVSDAIEMLNGRPTSSDKCVEAYDRFQDEPTDAARQVLKEAYEAMPEHTRQFVLGDMDVKDVPIRMIIYGEGEIENWSHRIVARQQGQKQLPTIYVKGARRRKSKS